MLIITYLVVGLLTARKVKFREEKKAEELNNKVMKEALKFQKACGCARSQGYSLSQCAYYHMSAAMERRVVVQIKSGTQAAAGPVVLATLAWPGIWIIAGGKLLGRLSWKYALKFPTRALITAWALFWENPEKRKARRLAK